MEVLASVVQVAHCGGFGEWWVFPEGFDGEAGEWREVALLEGRFQGGEGRREEGSMGESYEVGRGGSVVDGGQGSGREGAGATGRQDCGPEVLCCGTAGAMDSGVVGAVDGASCGVEVCSTAGVAELAHGEERVAESWENVGVLGCWGETGDGEFSSVCGVHDFLIGNLDGEWIRCWPDVV